MKKLIFIQPHSPYAEGDIVVREENEAKELIDSGTAKYLEEPVKNKMVGSPKVAKRIKKRK